MKFIINKKAKVPNYRDCYVIEVTAMFGDADGYKTFELGPFKNNEEYLKYLEEAVITCREMGTAYLNGRGGGDDYQSDDPDEKGYVAGFSSWFGYEMDEDNPRCELSHDWPSTPDGYGDQASFDGFEVFYYDETGVKYDVKIKD